MNAEWESALAEMERSLAEWLADGDRRPALAAAPRRTPDARLNPSTGAEWEGRLRLAKRHADEAEIWLRDQEQACERWLGAFTRWRAGLEQPPTTAGGGNDDGARGGDPPGGG